jgi:hypothetical protein
VKARGSATESERKAASVRQVTSCSLVKEHDAAFSARMITPESCVERTLENEGAGNARCMAAPIAPCAK